MATEETPATEPAQSVTRLQTMQRCGMQAKFRYVDGLKMQPGVQQVRGGAVHFATGLNFRQKIDSRKDLPLDTMTDTAAQSVEQSFVGGVALTSEERTVGVTILKGRTIDDAVSLTRVVAESMAPGIQPVMAEQQISVRLRPQAEGERLLTVKGILDLADDQARIHDLKTSASKPGADDAETSQQLSIYALLYRSLTKKTESAVVLNTAVRTKAGNTSFYQQATQRQPVSLQVAAEKLHAADEAFRKGVFLPTNPDNWWCSEKWCGYWNICPYVRDRRR